MKLLAIYTSIAAVVIGIIVTEVAEGKELDSDAKSFPCSGKGRLTGSIHFLQWHPQSDELMVNYDDQLYVVATTGEYARKVADSRVPVSEYAWYYTKEGRTSPEAYKHSRFWTEGLYGELSPEGKRLLYSTCEFNIGTEADFNFESRIGLSDPVGTAAIMVPEEQRFAHYPTWSPDGTIFAHLSSDRRSTVNRLVIRSTDPSDGFTITRIINDGRILQEAPQWSPDGKRIAFVTHKGNSWYEWRHENTVLLHIMDVRKGSTEVIAETAGLPAWSPDGNKLAFVGLDGHKSNLYTIRPDGTEKTLVTETPEAWGPYWDERPLWSPSGDRIMFAINIGGLHIVNADGTRKELISQANILAMAWSPDGGRIALLEGRHIGNKTLTTMNSDGQRRKVLALGVKKHGLLTVKPLTGDRQNPQSACTEGTIIPDPEKHPMLVQDCITLISLRETLAGARVEFERFKLDWHPWTMIEEWEGITTGRTPRRVIGISLFGTVLEGEIPPEIAQLDQLHRLNLQGNYLTGDIPPSIANLKKLRYLDLSDNHLDREAEWLGEALPDLKVLDVTENRFEQDFSFDRKELQETEFPFPMAKYLPGCIRWEEEAGPYTKDDVKLRAC